MPRRASFCFLASALACLALAAQAPKPSTEDVRVEEILAAHYDAIGGVDAWQAVASSRLTGEMSVGPIAGVPFVLVHKRPSQVRLDFTINQMTWTQAYDGESAWSVVPVASAGTPAGMQVMDEGQTRTMREMADFAGPLVGFRAKGHRIALAGVVEIGGGEYYKLEVILAGGGSQTHYLDRQSLLPARQERWNRVGDEDIRLEVLLEDFREVDGLLMAHRFITVREGEPTEQIMKITRVELNTEVEEGYFTMPAAEAQTRQPTNGSSPEGSLRRPQGTHRGSNGP